MDANITSPQFHAAICVTFDLIHWRAPGGHSLCHLIKKKNMNCMSVTYPWDDPWNVKEKTWIQTPTLSCVVECEVMKRRETGGNHLHFLGVGHGVSGLCAWWKRQSAGWAAGIETTAVRPWGIWPFYPCTDSCPGAEILTTEPSC